MNKASYALTPVVIKIEQNKAVRHRFILMLGATHDKKTQVARGTNTACGCDLPSVSVYEPDIDSYAGYNRLQSVSKAKQNRATWHLAVFTAAGFLA